MTRQRPHRATPRRRHGLLARLVLLTTLIATWVSVASAGLIAAQEPTAENNNLASITIYAAQCPTGYQGDTYFQDCYANAAGEGTTFTLTNTVTGERYTGTTGTDGFAAIEGVDQNGTYRLTDDLPNVAYAAAVACSARGERFPVATSGAGATLDLTTADDLRCDWSIIPRGDDATTPAAEIPFPVYVLNCETSRESPAPPSDTFPPDDCALAEGVTINLETEDEEALGSCTTDTEGTCTVPVPVWPDGAAPVVVARQQFLTIADGYDPTQSEVRMELMGDDSAAVFVNILIAGSGPFPFPIYAATCEEAPEIFSPFAAAFPPKGCVATEGAIASVALRDGTEIGTCTIDADAACTVDAPFASTVIVTLDEATILNGYIPRQNPVTTRVYTEFASAVFLIVPSTTGMPSPVG